MVVVTSRDSRTQRPRARAARESPPGGAGGSRADVVVGDDDSRTRSTTRTIVSAVAAPMGARSRRRPGFGAPSHRATLIAHAGESVDPGIDEERQHEAVEGAAHDDAGEEGHEEVHPAHRPVGGAGGAGVPGGGNRESVWIGPARGHEKGRRRRAAALFGRLGHGRRGPKRKASPVPARLSDTPSYRPYDRLRAGLRRRASSGCA